MADVTDKRRLTGLGARRSGREGLRVGEVTEPERSLMVSTAAVPRLKVEALSRFYSPAGRPN